MIEKTNLDKCKEIAKAFLHLDIDASSEFAPVVVSHPFFESVFQIDRETNQLVNILEDEVSYSKAIESMKERIDSIEEYSYFACLITKPYRLAFLKHTKLYVDKTDFSKYLIDAWVSDEYANQNVNVPPNELLQYFKEASKEDMMDDEELEVYSQLNDVVIIYRGVTSYNDTKIKKALSWTLDKTKAEWFAKRFNQLGVVYQAKINKTDILTYCDQRNEKEVIVDYTKLKDIQISINWI